MTRSGSNNTTDESSPQSGRCLLICGSGRCGTSAMAGIVKLLGVDMGSKFLAADSGNPRGYWEHLEIHRLHHHLRNSMGLHWDYISPWPDGWWATELARDVQRDMMEALRRDFVDSSFWSIKENKVCRYMKIWEEIFRHLDVAPTFLIMFRHPYEVAASFERKEGLPLKKGLILWLLYNLDVERDTRQFPRAFVSFDSLLLNWRKAISRVEQRLGLQWPRVPSAVENRIDEFLEPRMRHYAQSKTASVSVPGLPPLFLDVYESLKIAETGEAYVTEVFDRARGEIETQTASLYVQNLIQHIQGLDETCRYMRDSRSWKITAPLRRVYDFMQRVMR